MEYFNFKKWQADCRAFGLTIGKPKRGKYSARGKNGTGFFNVNNSIGDLSIFNGTRVTLKADKAEGWPAQRAVYLQQSGTAHMVEVIPEDRDDDYDDGLVEVTWDQMELRKLS